jgi:hypothetical protein
MLEVSLSSITFAHFTFYIIFLSLLLAPAFVLLSSYSTINITVVFILSASTFAISILSSAIVHLFPILFSIFALVLALMTIYFYKKLHPRPFLVYVILTEIAIF